jgi:ABC-type branched-subunit amino acid transport system permease subunit
MGMMIFTMASGLTLIFGLMDVLNFGHGAFIAVGAYVATLALAPLTAGAGRLAGAQPRRARARDGGGGRWSPARSAWCSSAC